MLTKQFLLVTKIILFFPLFLCFSCAHKKQSKLHHYDKDLVTVHTALEQAKQSFILGCVTAHKQHSTELFYPVCVKQAKKHIGDLRIIMSQPVFENSKDEPIIQ